MKIAILILLVLIALGGGYLISSQQQEPVVLEPEPTACTADAMQCPDGSYVGRSGPNCEFICPESPKDENETFCQPEQRNVDACIEIYQPVCANVQVLCITEPCNPVQETYSNSCFACNEEKVISYTEGACN